MPLIFNSASVAVPDTINANVAGAVDINAGTIDVSGNVSTVSTDTSLVNETLTVNNDSPNLTLTNFQFLLSPSPPAHAYLVEVNLSLVNGWTGSEEAYVQAQILWYGSQSLPVSFVPSPLALSVKENPVGPTNEGVYLLSAVIPASLIINQLLLQVNVYAPGGPTTFDISVGITGYTAAIPVSKGNVAGLGLSLEQCLQPASLNQTIALTTAGDTYYTTGYNFRTIIKSISNTSATGVLQIRVYNSQGVSQGVIAEFSGENTINVNYYLPPNWVVGVNNTQSGVYAIVTFAQI